MIFRDSNAERLNLSSDRRKTQRYITALDINIRFMADGTPIKGSGVEMGPNGMRVLTAMPLAESTYLHISFENASNDTHCEGRVVWTKKAPEGDYYESGVDIQRWGGGVPSYEVIQKIPGTRPKPDRRSKPRRP